MKLSPFAWRAFLFCLAGVPLCLSCLVGSAQQPAGGVVLSKEDLWLAKLSSLAQQGEVDQLVEQVVHNWEPSRKEEAWKILGKLGCDLITWEQQKFQMANLSKLLSQGQIIPASADFGGLCIPIAKEVTDREFVLTNRGESNLLVRAEKIFFRIGSAPRGLFVSSGSIECSPRALAGTGVYLANDFVFGLSGAVIVCDGEFRGSVYGALIIAREGVEYWHVGGSVILSGGPVRSHYKTAPGIGNSTIISASSVEVPPQAKVNNSIIKPNQPDALGPVKFFEPARVGIEVDLAKGVVQIKKLDPAKMFAQAGLQTGDVLLALDKSPVKSVEGFRKQLRHSLAVQKQLTFEVRRGEKTMTISVQNKG